MKWYSIITKIIIFFSFPFWQTIEWCENKKIVWEDFQGYKPKDNTFFANISTKILIEYTIAPNESPNYYVKATMNRSQSWKEGNLSQKLLQHEQLHFDICELYARKIRKSVDSLRKEKVIGTLTYDSLIHAHLRMEKARNNLYDLETNHSTNIEKQFEWDEKIRRELVGLKEYASSSKNCK